MTAALNPGASGSPADLQQTGGPTPVTIGNQIAGSFSDATGHSAQSHLVYAANAGVWWLFTLTSDADSEGGSNHVVKSFHSSGPDLTTATWIAGADSPPLAAGTPNQSLGGGRSLGIAYLNNAPLDVIHADVSMAFDGQDGRTGHIRAVVNGTAITWSSWNAFDEPAATWTLPRANTIGVSSGKFIHTGGPILQQEVDANVRKSNNADTGSTWTSGFSAPVVVDNSMMNQDNALAFAPLANDVMLAVYDNGQGTEPNQTNLRYKRSNSNGTWSGTVVGSQLGGDGDVFPTSATINQNDWGLVSVSTSEIYVFRRNAKGSGIDAATYDVAANDWSPMSPAPPALGAGQSFKSGAGLFGTTDGTSVWVCVINTDVANSILCTRFDGQAWTAWSAVAGTEIGSQNRKYISGSRRVGANQVGLIWTEGTSLFDVVAISFPTTNAAPSPDVKPPAVSLTSPAAGATVAGTISISATASDNVGVAGVQFRLDGADLGVEITAAPYSMRWDTTSATDGDHVLTAIARDEAGNTTTAASRSVTVGNEVGIVPNVTSLTRDAAAAAIVAAGLTLGNETQVSSATIPAGIVISQSPAAGTGVAVNSAVDLVISAGPAPATVPDVVGLTQAAATAAIADAGLTLGAVTTASSPTVPEGSVISQTPKAGAQVASGTAVALVVSSGPPNIAVPNVVGLSQAAAAAALTDAELAVGAVTTAASTTVPSGSVISQTPAAGTQVTSGTAVALVVSSGPPKVAVPNVVGLAQAAAATAITDAGLIVGAVSTATSPVAAGVVLAQNPAAGANVLASSAVDVLVSSGPGSGPPLGTGAIGIDFVGKSAPIRSGEIAGVVPQPNWNSADGAEADTPLALVDETGTSTGATVTWSAASLWLTQIQDAPGNPGMMKGYLNTSTKPNNPSTTTVTVSGLARRTYDVYVYTDGDNRADLRSASYSISGPDITTTTITVIDAPDTDFTGTFTAAEDSAGNYVKFRIAATGFTISATPVSSVKDSLRAPLNGIQIVPTAIAGGDFTIAAAPETLTVTAGELASYTATINQVNTFSGPVELSVSGAPIGTTVTSTPTSLDGSGEVTLDIATSSETPSGNWPLTITATSGPITKTTTVTLVVAEAIGIKFLGLNPETMAVADSAGVVPQTHWNNAAGAGRTTPLALVDDSGARSTATATWQASGLWRVGIVDQPGNPRLMKGTLANANDSVITISVDGLPLGDYDVYLYCDGDNNAIQRTATYQISGPGITPAAVQVTDLPFVNFAGTFIQAADSAGNYVKFRITGSGFTITATPGTSTNLDIRAPINAIQIVRIPQP
jgi:beta-lactam-binding protein with PASTA domain